MLDVVPAVVIMISAVVAGLSADMDDEHSNIVWEADPKLCDPFAAPGAVGILSVQA